MRTRNRGKQQAGLEPEIIDGDDDGDDDEVCITMVSPPPNRPARLGGSQDGLSAPGDSVAPPPRDAWREAMKDGLDNPSVAAAAPPFGGSVKVMTGGSLGLSPMMWPSSLTGPVRLAGGVVPGPSAAAEPSAVFADSTGSAPPSENTLTVEEVIQSTEADLAGLGAQWGTNTW